MNGQAVLFPEREIQARIAAMAHDIARRPARPDIIVPVLIGAFVFAADLSRALAREGCDLPVEFLWLRSYSDERRAGEMIVRAGPGGAVRAKHVLLIDGVLDHGHTLAAARDLLISAGAAAVTTAVVVDKRRDSTPFAADLACFTGITDYIIGYGMDDAGLGRGLPYIAKAG